MVRVLVVASLVWPLLLGVAVWERAQHGPTNWAGVIYLAASRVCHQRPARSFQTVGVQWPVCGRCSGLYLAAPAGALAALVSLRRRSAGRYLAWLEPFSLPRGVTRAAITRQAAEFRHRARYWGVRTALAAASLPTAATLALEWMNPASVTNVVRAIAAVPLGVLIAFVVIRAAAGSRGTIG